MFVPTFTNEPHISLPTLGSNRHQPSHMAHIWPRTRCPPQSIKQSLSKSFWYLRNRKKTVECIHRSCIHSMFRVSTRHVHWGPLQGCKYMSSHACPPTYLYGRDCRKAVHLLLDSPAFQSCFMSLLQNNWHFNIFLVSTWALRCSREVKFPPAVFCNQ